MQKFSAMPSAVIISLIWSFQHSTHRGWKIEKKKKKGESRETEGNRRGICRMHVEEADGRDLSRRTWIRNRRKTGTVGLSRSRPVMDGRRKFPGFCDRFERTYGGERRHYRVDRPKDLSWPRSPGYKRENEENAGRWLSRMVVRTRECGPGHRLLRSSTLIDNRPSSFLVAIACFKVKFDRTVDSSDGTIFNLVRSFIYNLIGPISYFSSSL